MSMVRKKIPIAIVFVLTLLMLVEFYIDLPVISPAVKTMNSGFLKMGVMIGNFAILMGVVVICRYHFKEIQRKEIEQKVLSSLLLLFLFGTIIAGIVFTPSSDTYMWVFTNLNIIPVTAVSSLGLFWMISAVYRSFTVKSKEASIMFIACVIALLGSCPLGVSVEPISQWITQVPTKAASTGIVMSAAIGTLMICYRVMVGKEKGALGGAE